MEHIEQQPSWKLNCPIPIALDSERMMLAHGEGGRLMRRLIRDHIIPSLGRDVLSALDDAARLPAINGPIAITTDSFVISPLFFPGGDIGTLAVYGTVNDLAVTGAVPRYLTLSLILEEGFPIELLDRILKSVASAATNAAIQIVAGDTKVVPRGAADGLFINTTGVGQLIAPIPVGPMELKADDELLVTGPIGRHGIAVLCAREELALEPPPQSDCAPLVNVCELLRQKLGKQIRAMRDATRGGVAAVLHEWAEASGLTLTINERNVPVSSDVRGACELLGLDPLHVANEGTMVIAVESGASEAVIEVLKSLPEYQAAAKIGTVTKQSISPVTIFRTLGPEQPLDDPLGTPLPRIC
jgi:hydrogenase expression/formation protein HypE